MIDFTQCQNIEIYDYYPKSKNSASFKYKRASFETDSIDSSIGQKLATLKRTRRHAGWMVFTDVVNGLQNGLNVKYFIEIVRDSEWFRRRRMFLHLNGLFGKQRISLNSEHIKRLLGVRSIQKGMGHRTAVLLSHITQTPSLTTMQQAKTIAQNCKSLGEWGKKHVRKRNNLHLATFLQTWTDDSARPIVQTVRARMKTLGLTLPDDWTPDAQTAVTKEEFIQKLAEENDTIASDTHLPCDGSALLPEEALLLRAIAEQAHPSSTQIDQNLYLSTTSSYSFDSKSPVHSLHPNTTSRQGRAFSHNTPLLAFNTLCVQVTNSCNYVTSQPGPSPTEEASHDYRRRASIASTHFPNVSPSISTGMVPQHFSPIVYTNGKIVR